MKPKQINTAQAKDNFNKILTEVNQSRKPVIIEKRGEPVAAVIDIKTYREKIGQESLGFDDELLNDLRKFHRLILEEKSGHPTGDSVEILRQLRQES